MFGHPTTSPIEMKHFLSHVCCLVTVLTNKLIHFAMQITALTCGQDAVVQPQGGLQGAPLCIWWEKWTFVMFFEGKACCEGVPVAQCRYLFSETSSCLMPSSD